MQYLPFYKTRDQYIASTLFALGKKIDSTEWSNGQCYFVFEDLVDCEDVVKDYYWNRLKVSPLELFNAHKVIKAMVYN